MKTFPLFSDSLTDDRIKAIGLNQDLWIKAQAVINRVHAQREEILQAFVTKYGFELDRFIQVEKQTSNGREWFVVRRSDERMAELSKLSAEL